MMEDKVQGGNASRSGSKYMRNKCEVMEQSGRKSTDGKNKGKKKSVQRFLVKKKEASIY